jgi:alkyl sulfatase BDS1-like metallo-beta-lactamase superfamily hydrolase
MCQYCFNKNQKEATKYTLERNRKFAQKLGLDQLHCTNSEYELAKEKCIYPAKEMVIRAEDGHEVWNLKAFSFFEQEEAPGTVNPSLWMNGKSNYLAGVFEVVKGAIYQVRGFDISNLTIIRSKTGWIVQDVMTTVETSRAAIQLL